MPVKTLRWWEAEFHRACILACLYRVPLSLEQFCASRGLEMEDKNQLQDYLAKQHTCI